VLRAALRRFLVLTVSVSIATLLGSLLLGFLAGTSVDRSLYLGFYWVGAFALIAGVFVGSRGPVRVKSESAGSSPIPVPFFSGNRMLRWATQQEQEETIHNSGVFVAVGLVLLLIGFALDTRHSLF
jgi:hypothetical protein